MNLQTIVRNICLACNHKWLGRPGAFGAHYKTGCPECESLYWNSTEINGDLK